MIESLLHRASNCAIDSAGGFIPGQMSHASLAELYSCPENVLDIQVQNPITQKEFDKAGYIDYEIICKVNRSCNRSIHI